MKNLKSVSPAGLAVSALVGVVLVLVLDSDKL